MPNASAGVPKSNANPISAGPTVKLISIKTESIANAVRRCPGSSKRWRHSVRISTEIGVTNAPATMASGAMAVSGSCSGAAKSSRPNAAGCTIPVATRTPRGP